MQMILKRMSLSAFKSSRLRQIESSIPQDQASAVLEYGLGKSSDELAPKSTTKFFTWEDLPFEIRDLIFDFLDNTPSQTWFTTQTYFKWKGAMPDVIVAFRSLPTSHRHAMQRFSKDNEILRLAYNFRWFSYCLNTMTAIELSSLKKIYIDLEGIRSRIEELKAIGLDYEHKWQLQQWFTHPFLKANNLRTVILRFFTYDEDNQDPYYKRFLTEFPFWLQGCSTVSKVTVIFSSNRTMDFKHGTRRRVMKSMIRRILERVGVEGQRYRETDYRSHRNHEWVWETGPGTSMNWTGDIGVKWPPRNPSIEMGFWSFWEDKDALLELDDDMFVIDKFHEEYDDYGRLVQSESSWGEIEDE